MFFQECEIFAKEYESLRSIISEMDNLLHFDNGSNLYNPEDIAGTLRKNPSQISIICKKLFELKLLEQETYIECQRCDNLIGSDKLDEAWISDDLLECTQCGCNILDQEISEVNRYRLNKNKVLDKEKRSREVINVKPKEILKENLVDFGIITVLNEERDAVLKYLDSYDKKKIDARTYYIGEIKSGSRLYKIALIKAVKMGNVESALATNDLINIFNPNFIAMIGIAGGIPRDGLDYGDVVFANQIIDYEYSKLLPDSVESRTTSHLIDHSFIDSAQNFNWEGIIEATCPSDEKNKKSKLFIGPIASGNKVITDDKQIKKILSYNSKTIAVEMEGEGVCTAAWQLSVPKKTLVIRGISDMADANKDAVDWHPYSAFAAAKFFIDFIKSNAGIF